VLALLIAIGGVACSALRPKSDEEAEVPITSCAEPRPQACTRELIPVCGHLYGGKPKTYDNACAACADPDVSGRQAGACEEPAPGPDDPPGSTD